MRGLLALAGLALSVTGLLFLLAYVMPDVTLPRLVVASVAIPGWLLLLARCLTPR